MISNKEIYGDFQTPKSFCDKVVELLKTKYGISPESVLEPTLGEGHFLESAIEQFPGCKLYGVDINEDYIKQCEQKFGGSKKAFVCASAFDFRYSTFVEDDSRELLVIGNPPWATNSDLSSDGTINLPKKSNDLKKNKGFDAISGSSNFDIAEYILIHVFSEFINRENTTFAFLIKSIVARNLFKDSSKHGFNYSLFDVYSFDAHEVFGVSCDACLLICRITANNKVDHASVYFMDSPDEVYRKFGYVEGVFVSNVEDYVAGQSISGRSQIEWRQGIKHDCSKVMELTESNGKLTNKLLEDCSFLMKSGRVFPLVKSSEVKGGIKKAFKHFVIVTQDKAGQNTDFLKDDALLWAYLESHKEYFGARKSSIYKKAYPYSIFGVGDYSFSKYKIAISGFYKKPSFTF